MRITDAAGHEVPDCPLIRAQVDTLPAEGRVNDLEIALDHRVGIRVQDRTAVRVENHVGRLASQHQLPRLAGVLTAPDAAIGAA